jgi:hypothetical protein
LAFVRHEKFGVGAILGEKVTDSGVAVHVWFVDSGRTKTVLAEVLTEATKPELTKEQARSLRHTVAEFKKSRPRRVRKAADKPRARRPDTKPEWRRTSGFDGREDELAPAEETEDAAE